MERDGSYVNIQRGMPQAGRRIMEGSKNMFPRE